MLKWKRAKMRNLSTTLHAEKERAMETSMFECGICFYQGKTGDFTPVTASADHAALECPNCLNNDKDTFTEIDIDVREAA